MNAEIEAMMAANKAAMEENQEEADVSQEEMASRSVPIGDLLDISFIRIVTAANQKQVHSKKIDAIRNQD